MTGSLFNWILRRAGLAVACVAASAGAVVALGAAGDLMADRTALLLSAAACIVAITGIAADQVHGYFVARIADARVKALFLNTIGHEVRTPLNGVLGATDLLLDTRLTPEQRTYANTVRTAAQSLSTVLEDVIAFAGAVDGREFSLNPAPTNIAQIVEGVAEVLTPKAQAKGLEIVTILPPNLPPVVALDEARFRQILMHLIGNGVKFATTGGVSVRVCAQAASTRGDAASAEGDARPRRFVQIEIVVEDTGPGLQGRLRRRAFRPFFQASQGFSRKADGLGLGLSVSQRIAEAMGGSIEAAVRQDRPGGRFVLRVVVPGEMPPARAPSAANLPKTLIISPSTMLAEGLRTQMRALRAGAVEVATPSQAPGVLCAAERAEARYELVLFDSGAAPHNQVVAAFEALRRQLDHPERLRALLLISPGERDGLQWIFDAGFAGYLIKPVRSRALLRRLDALDDGSATRRYEPQRVAKPMAPTGPIGDNNTPDDAWERQAGAPAPSPSSPAKSSLLTPVDSADAPAAGLEILLAEDNEINVTLSRALLGRLGHRVSVVRDGAAAIAAVKSQPFDAVLMDVHMPEVDGLEATRSIRALPGPARDIPIIALTANAFESDRQMCLDAGMNEHLAKPLDPTRLAAVLQSVRHSTVSPVDPRDEIDNMTPLSGTRGRG